MAKQDKAAKPRSAAKSHTDYWKPRLFRPWYTRDGAKCEVNDLAIRIQHAGRRETFTLGTTNRDAAAIKARDLYLAIKGAGWEAATVRQYKPDEAPRSEATCNTIGDVIRAATNAKSAAVGPRTLRDYASNLRHLAALTLGWPCDDRTRFDYATGGLEKWRTKTDAIALVRLVPAEVQAALNARINAARGNPLLQRRVRTSCAAVLRNAKACLAAAAHSPGVPLPHDPFDGVKITVGEPPKYKSSFDAGVLLRTARQELAPTDPEAYKALLLALGAGLRKGEIDALRWCDVDMEKGVIRVETTDSFAPKTDDSEGEVYVDLGLLAELDQYRPKAAGSFVLESPIAPRPGVSYSHRRAERTFDRLNRWLKAQGVEALKPLHTLRKEFGSIINATAGIHAASVALRHSNIATTSRYYADARRRVAPPIGAMLAAGSEAKPVVLDAQLQPSAASAAAKITPLPVAA